MRLGLLSLCHLGTYLAITLGSGCISEERSKISAQGESALATSPPCEPQFQETKIFGHRGASARYPENTLAAVRAAMTHFDGAEIDIQLTKDRVLIVLHDDTLRRTADSKDWQENRTVPPAILDTPVDQLNWSQIAKVVTGPQGETLPTLRSVLDLLPKFPSKKLLIEIKSYESASPSAKTAITLALEDLLSRLPGSLLAQIIFISFDDQILHDLGQKSVLRSIPRYWLLTGAMIEKAAAHKNLASLLDQGQAFEGFDIESGPYLERPLVNGQNIVAMMKERKKRVITWISRKSGTDGIPWLKVSQKLGVDIFTSDLPEDIWSLRLDHPGRGQETSRP